MQNPPQSEEASYRHPLCSRYERSAGCAAGGAGAASSPAGAAGALYGLLATLLRRAPRDFSLTSLATLSTLDRTGPRRITDLAVIEGVTQPSMTVLVAEPGAGRPGGAARRPRRRARHAGHPHGQGLRYLQRRRSAGTDALAELVDKLPPDEAAALAAAIPALRHLRDLDNEQREPESRAPGEQQAPG